MNVEFHPDSPTAWATLGSAEAEADNREEAITAYRRALELAPDNPQILRALRALGVDP
jgi:cytochrome c-type biogenesis protein CcmH/NrfG